MLDARDSDVECVDVARGTRSLISGAGSSRPGCDGTLGSFFELDADTALVIATPTQPAGPNEKK
jgi:hypothetical protein